MKFEMTTKIRVDQFLLIDAFTLKQLEKGVIYLIFMYIYFFYLEHMLRTKKIGSNSIKIK